MQFTKRATKGTGLLENYLSSKRAGIAKLLVPENLKKGKALDIGCGFKSIFLQSSGFSEKHGIERVPVSLTGNIIIAEKDLEKDPVLPYQDGYFDVVTALAVFEHFEKDVRTAVAKEIRRVLKKDGVFILTMPSPWAENILRLMASINLVSREEIDEHKSMMGLGDIRTMCLDSGFENDRIRTGYFELFMNQYAAAGR